MNDKARYTSDQCLGWPIQALFWLEWATTLPPKLPMSLGAKPRDLQFRGLLLETRNTMLKQNCHLACPGVPWDRSVAERRDLRCLLVLTKLSKTPAT